MQATNASAPKPILSQQNIQLGLKPEMPQEAIRRCGRMLAEAGYVKEEYIKGMLARDAAFSTAIGNLIAIPHGEKEYKEHILCTGVVVITYPDGIDWNGVPVKLVIGIAAKGDEHLSILENIVETLEEEEDVVRLVNAGDAQAIYKIFTAEGESI
ncbi:PTS sugar transporter subunit IIA [Hydrogenoanaerobacterium sp.]|uniref:PTS sugar transporter subunit IIA n=1 Tax=Hydrogenoanaerobacterium sp. TaxID=2953763 RepID=UPI00289FA683|nr:PTS sugar transporter subunit IIA [Hydrogenoanaerobacterium sp.]